MSSTVAKVALVRCADYSPDRVDAAVDRLLAPLGGLGSYVRAGDRVLLKVNLLAPAAPERAVTTHPAVVRALIRQVRAAGGVPLVGDCSAFEGPPSAGRFRQVCRKAGLLPLVEEEGAQLVHLAGDAVEVEAERGRAFRRFIVARAVREADVVISLPKLKTHSLTLLTGAVKNLFGCLPGLHKAQMHLRGIGREAFSQMLVDLLAAIPPTLTVMDAVVGMEGPGPRNGRPRWLGAMLAGTDPVAIDAIACQLVGVDPLDLPTCRLAMAQGLGIADRRQIEVAGDSPTDLQVADFRLPPGRSAWALLERMPSWLVQGLQDRISPRPAIDPTRCQRCAICAQHCPPEALSRHTRIPIFDYRRCIRCYCCQELCPHDAIVLHQPWLARRLLG